MDNDVFQRTDSKETIMWPLAKHTLKNYIDIHTKVSYYVQCLII